jgi:uncharacterized membrane protein (DUF106 family)
MLQENTVKSLERELVVKSEADLDRRLQMLEYKMSHESMPIAEEKNMIREIKTLGNLRESVREFQVRKAAVTESRQDRDGEERMLLKVLKEEVELLKMQENILREIFRKRQVCVPPVLNIVYQLYLVVHARSFLWTEVSSSVPRTMYPSCFLPRVPTSCV